MKYEERGLRFLLTFGCSKKCPFCYQLDRTDDRRILPLDRFEEILRLTKKDRYDYLTLFGGEVMEIPDFTEYVRAARAAFDGRINITTNGDASIKAYVAVVDAGVDHINFSMNTPPTELVKNKLDRIARMATTRINMFLPTEYDEARMNGIIRPWIAYARPCTQVSLMYDYRTDIGNYDAAVEKIIDIVDHVDPGNVLLKHVGPNYLVFGIGAFEFWVDVNYRKNQELIVDPQGNLTRGFDYMDEKKP